MALRTTWNHSDTSNRIISEPLDVRYVTNELFYNIPPKGDGTPPDYVTDAEDALEAATSDLEDAIDAREAIEEDLSEAKALADAAYSTWYMNQTLGNYQAWALKQNAYATVKTQAASIDAAVNSATIAVNKAKKELDAANERWATESQTIEYKGGRFVGFEHRRIAKMRMQYLGFDLSAAEGCKAYFDTLYTRNYSRSAAFHDGVPEVLMQKANTSSVRIIKGDGDNYSVEIEVEEEDVKLTTTNVEASTLFTEENERVYL